MWRSSTLIWQLNTYLIVFPISCFRYQIRVHQTQPHLWADTWKYTRQAIMFLHFVSSFQRFPTKKIYKYYIGKFTCFHIIIIHKQHPITSCDIFICKMKVHFIYQCEILYNSLKKYIYSIIFLRKRCRHIPSVVCLYWQLITIKSKETIILCI